jgi:hypothetical protein
VTHQLLKRWNFQALGQVKVELGLINQTIQRTKAGKTIFLWNVKPSLVPIHYCIIFFNAVKFQSLQSRKIWGMANSKDCVYTINHHCIQFSIIGSTLEVWRLNWNMCSCLCIEARWWYLLQHQMAKTVIIHALIANYNHRLKKLVFRTFISKICLVCFCLLTSYWANLQRKNLLLSESDVKTESDLKMPYLICYFFWKRQP